MFFEESDNKNPRERANDNMMRQMLGDGGYDSGGVDFRGRRQGMTRSGRSVGGESSRSCGCGNIRGGRDNSPGCCGCGGDSGAAGPEIGRRTWGLSDYPLGIVYAPLQEWRELYDLETGYSRGTIFRELDLPFLASTGAGAGGTCGTRGGCCRG